MIFHFISLTVVAGIVIATALFYHHFKKDRLPLRVRGLFYFNANPKH